MRPILSKAAARRAPKCGVIAVLGAGGASAPKRTAVVVAPRPKGKQVAITVSASNGDYRAGDEIWCDVVEADGFAAALNRDVLVPRPAGRFLFGRLIDRDGERLQLLPPGAGGRQQIVANPPWIAVATRLGAEPLAREHSLLLRPWLSNDESYAGFRAR